MNADQREQVLDAARYLRSVRPLDPEELCEYVEGRPHPAVVRQVLRESAVDLRVREREDGTFTPVEEGPAEVGLETVRRFPSGHEARLEDLLVERYGTEWYAGESGDRLRATIRRVKEDYYRQHPVEYDAETALAYALYHLPDYYAVAQYALADLGRAGLLPRTLRVLDVGAGVGGPALGLLDLLAGEALVDYHAVEPSAAADVFERLVVGRENQRVTVHRETAEDFEIAETYDLVLFANVWSELDDPASVARRYAAGLADDGTLLGLAPADKNTAVGLREVERTLERESDLSVYGPEVRLWPGVTPSDRGWSFDVEPDLAVPEVQRRLDDAATDPDGDPGEFVNVDVQYASTVLRRDGARAVDVAPDAERFARMADAEDHVTDRIDLLAVKLSHDLGRGNPLFRIGDGSQSVDHYAVCTRESALNRDLLRADFGDLLVVENGLLLWNDDERAYNLVVDAETAVDAVPT
ncbi:methyltransferase domain-containing protein [Halomarina ordinaria]|uniref:Methyltransferase domain-containing protein n=1 Tax=Halomarina ordinaria TaxID=3033939 RepID=A0ABD5U919_9EURY|nr:methyltransferase domain-containing protein [Halomarina sp. PSRA2]